MSRSGSYSLSVTRNQIITTAFLDMTAYAPGQVPTAAEINDASLRLNMMIKAMQATGVGLWLNREAMLPLQYEAQSYLIGPSGGRCAWAMSETALTADAVSGAVSVTLDEDNTASGDNIGIKLDSGFIHWTTTSGPGVASVVPLTDALTGDAGEGNIVFSYPSTVQVQRPLNIVEARLRDENGNDLSLIPMSQSEYMYLANKTSPGRTTQFYYDPQLDNGVLYLWPVNTVMTDRIMFTGRIPIQVFDNLSDEPDFPAEWFDALHYNLALRMSTSYNVPSKVRNELKEMAAITLADADGFDREQGVSIQIVPNTGWGR